MKTLRIFISGLVQGIFFRDFIREQAENLGLKGYVRNLDDNRVEVVVEGDNNEVNKMIELCKKGPKESKVRDIEIEKIENKGFESFRILRI